MARKRGNSEGSIYQRSDGLWCAAITLPGRRRRVIYCRTRHEAAQKLAQALDATARGLVLDRPDVTVAAFLDEWLRDSVRPRVRPWTYRGYEVLVRRHITPVLGSVRLRRLGPQHVQHLIKLKLDEGLSPKTVNYMRGVLRTALEEAVRWGMLPRNVAKLVRAPRPSRFEIAPLTPEEARSFLEAAAGDRLQALYSVALSMGLRQAEALGVRWVDVDLERGVLRVEHQLQRVDGKLRLVELKTRQSRRVLALPSSVVEALRAHRVRQLQERLLAGERWTESGLVFTSTIGTPLDARTVIRQFHRLLDRAQLPQRRFHDLRHSCATLLLVQGVSPRVVMEILGHSEIGMTMNTYSHVIPELKRDAADRIESLLHADQRTR